MSTQEQNTPTLLTDFEIKTLEDLLGKLHGHLNHRYCISIVPYNVAETTSIGIYKEDGSLKKSVIGIDLASCLTQLQQS